MLLFRTTNLRSLAILSTITLILSSCGKDDGGDKPDREIEGEVELIKTFGGSGIDEAVSVVEAQDGNYMVLGNTRSSDGDITDRSGSDSDFWLLKISKSGEIIWSKTYGGSDDENAARITKTNDGGYLLSGYTTSNDGDVSGNEGFQDYWIVKVDASGTIHCLPH